ncbi:MAG: translation initiation factor IF-3 [Planctomycetes bacterium]|nr:translation initiation factor IF-3 [Planctomycetota bacterium]
MAFPRTPPPKPEHRLNEQIRVKQVRLIDDHGVMIGVVPTDQARQLARERGYDLVEVSPDAVPPVCKLLDYGKFKYEQKRKSRKAKKKTHVQQLKEVRLRPLTEEHDFVTKVKHTREFLEHGDKVLVTVFFKGREQAHKEIGRALMERIKKALDDIGKVERDISMLGPRMQITLAPKPGVKPSPAKAEAPKSKTEDGAQILSDGAPETAPASAVPAAPANPPAAEASAGESKGETGAQAQDQ